MRKIIGHPFVKEGEAMLTHDGMTINVDDLKRVKQLTKLETFIKENDPDLWHLWLITKEND